MASDVLGGSRWRAPDLSLSELAGVPAGLGVFALAASWPVYVFTGSQTAYLISLAATAVTVSDLVLRRSRLVVAFLVLLVGLIGTEASGALGRGDPPTGSLRLLDWAVAVGLSAALLGMYLEARRPSLRETARALGARLSGLAGGSFGTYLLAGLLAYAVALWIVNGAPRDGLLKADLRLIVLAGGTWVLTRHCGRGGWATLTIVICALAPLMAAKALGIRVSELWTIGSYDRLQASLLGGPPVRVILVGGDTLFVLMPALALFGAMRHHRRSVRVFLALCGVCAVAGLLLSGTRTSVAVAGFLAAAVAVAGLVGVRRISVRALCLGFGAVLVFGAVLIATGVGSRFTTPDPANVGLNFRKDELNTMLDLPARDLVLGQGLAGRFVGKDVNGQPIVAGWAHAFPAWVVLKVGLGGLLVALVLLFRLGRDAIRQAATGGVDQARMGAVLFIGMLALGLTLNRVALPEGAVLLTTAIALLTFPGTPDGS